MFGGNNANGSQPTSNRPAAADVAKIEGNLTYVLSTGTASDGLHVFVNAMPISTGELESLSINIVAPAGDNDPGVLTALASRYQTDAEGNRKQTSLSLFPGTVEIIAQGRRIVVNCPQEGSFDGLYLGLGLHADGTSEGLTGVQSLRVTATPGLGIDAKLEWVEDGVTEDLLPG